MGLLFGLGVIIICSTLAVHSNITVLVVVLLLLSIYLTFSGVKCRVYVLFNFFDLQYGETALMLAAEWGQLEVVRFLKEGGAAIYTQYNVGCLFFVCV